ncbi:MAG: hypothetical protein ACYDB4_17820 [Candidatus Dormibacteraceae bacterium]
MRRTFEFVCKGKQPWASQLEARDAVRRLGRRVGGGHKFLVYRCPFCSSWHFGHKPRAKNPSGRLRARQAAAVRPA